MSDSLLYGGVELLGGGVTQAAGWRARLAPGWDLGAAEPQTAVVESLLLDGERVTGDRSGDRTISLPLIIDAPSLSGNAARVALSAGIAALQMVANGRSSTLTWTPDGGLPAVFDTFRGKGGATWNLRYAKADVAAVQVDVTALPYSRSPDTTTVMVQSSVQVDAIDSGSMTGSWNSSIGGTFTSNTWSISGSNLHAEGSAAAYIGASWSGTLSGTSYFGIAGARTGLAAKDVSAAASLSLRYFWARPSIKSAVFSVYSATLTLTDNIGHTASIVTTPADPAVKLDASPFHPLSFPVPTAWPAGFDPTHVVAWAANLVMVITASGSLAYSGILFQAGFDDLEALPPISGGVTTTNGGTYRFAAIGGTARCPISVQATHAGGIGAVVLHKAPPEARADYAPLVPYASAGTTLGNPAPMPSYNGSTAGARYDGTHVVVLGGTVLGGSGARTISVTFTETFGDPVGGGTDTSVVSRVCAPADVLNGLLIIGVLTLPKRRVVADNTATSMTVTVADSGSNPTVVQDILVLDTRGPTVIVGQAYARDTIWVDEPDVLTGVGAVLIGSTLGGSANGRASAVSNWDSTTIDPGPLSFDPGDNTLLAYCPQGAVTLTASYAKRFLAEAV